MLPSNIKVCENTQLSELEHHYRPDVDGLRALAIIMVVAYHGFPSWIHGGFIGVDVFFVISGYLITNIIFSQIFADNFSIVSFYGKRIRRIFPALLLVTFAVFIAGWFLLAPRDFESLGSNIAGGALFIQNFVLLNQVGYFDIEAAKKPLLHLWSLGVEEQFYAAWPLLLLLFRRFHLDARTLTLALAIASFCLGLAIYRYNPDAAFYLPFTRAWELLAGSSISTFSLAAKLDPRRHWIDGRWHDLTARFESSLSRLTSRFGLQRSEKLAQTFFAAIALAGILFVMLRHKPFTPYPGSAALISVAATAILILTPKAAINRFFLSSRPMVFIGLISYPLYLWHFPLMAYARVLSEDLISGSAMAAIVAASAILAWLTYRFIEQPIRFGKQLVRFKIAALFTGMTGLGILGFGVTVTQGLPSRLPSTVRTLMQDSTNAAWGYGNWRGLHCLINGDPSTFSEKCSAKGQHPLILVWGDSFAAALLPGLDHFAGPQSFNISAYTASACPPLIGYVYDQRPFCKPTNDFVLRRIADELPDVVILHANWNFYVLKKDEVQKGLEETVEKLKALHIKRIFLIGPLAGWKGDGLASNVLDYYYQTGTLLPERTFYRSLDESTRAIEVWMEGSARELGISYISARNIMCNGEGCLTRIGDRSSILTAIDFGHLTEPASIFVVGSILNRLLPSN